MFAYEAGPIILIVLCQISGRLPDNSLIFPFGGSHGSLTSQHSLSLCDQPRPDLSILDRDENYGWCPCDRASAASPLIRSGIFLGLDWKSLQVTTSRAHDLGRRDSDIFCNVFLPRSKLHFCSWVKASGHGGASRARDSYNL